MPKKNSKNQQLSTAQGVDVQPRVMPEKYYYKINNRRQCIEHCQVFSDGYIGSLICDMCPNCIKRTHKASNRYIICSKIDEATGRV